MKTIRVLEYKYTGKFLNWAISAWTGLFNWNTPRYSHSEIWWPDEFGKFFNSTGIVGECFTSTMRGDYNGTVIRPARSVIKYAGRWDYFEIEVDDPKFKSAECWARIAAKRNKGYDKPAVMSFFLPIRFGSSSKDICSETAYSFLLQCGVFEVAKIPSPRRLAKWLMKLGYCRQCFS